ncbi:MAG: hypothetical protein ABI178_04130 [Rhodanobacter sp.]
MKAYSSLLLPILLFSLLGMAPLQARQAVSLQKQMGNAEFTQAGLDKLSPAELQHLQQWLALHASELSASVPASAETSATAAAAKSSGPFTHKAKAPQLKRNDTVTSRIAGEFNGWQRGTTMTLQNGQKWRVSDDSSLTVRKSLFNPEVSVKPGFMGSWVLKVEGYNTSAQVEPAN